jgi:hypothetical protein
VKSKLAMHLSPRCSATSKRTRQPCQAPAVAGWTVCRFHGAGGGGLRGERNGSYRHGLHTAEAAAERRAVADLVRKSRKAMADLRLEPDVQDGYGLIARSPSLWRVAFKLNPSAVRFWAWDLVYAILRASKLDAPFGCKLSVALFRPESLGQHISTQSDCIDC